jgi:hypothetical protein
MHGSIARLSMPTARREEMRQELALRVLSQIMNWDTEKVREEWRWLSVMSRLKYDSYRDFLAGARFIESLVHWLQQFASSDREAAYKFVRRHLAYFSEGELRHLVEQFYPETVCWHILSLIRDKHGLQKWEILRNAQAKADFERLRRSTLFLGLSDGARMDVLRRANVGRIGNEQVVATYYIDQEKWDSLLSDLRKETGDPEARFTLLYLIDDFVGSGRTLLRKEETGWTGKLLKVWRNIEAYIQTHFNKEWSLHIHHYIGTTQGRDHIDEQLTLLKQEGHEGFSQVPKLTFGLLLDSSAFQTNGFGAFDGLIERYYDPNVMTKHLEIGGKDVKHGFAHCCLPVVLEHNTPNNSVGLLWAESKYPSGGHAMRPLFRRRERHS